MNKKLMIMRASIARALLFMTSCCGVHQRTPEESKKMEGRLTEAQRKTLVTSDVR